MKSRFLFQKQSTPQRMKKAVFSPFESYPNQKKQIYQNQLYYNSPNQNKSKNKKTKSDLTNENIHKNNKNRIRK